MALSLIVGRGEYMSSLQWILSGGVAMSAIALIGSLTLALSERRLKSLIPNLVALASGSLTGGALFHLLPESLLRLNNQPLVFGMVGVGFIAFLILEQFLSWHHCHHVEHSQVKAFSYLILLGDGLHNFLGGLAIGATFLADIRLGITAWCIAALHEIPQELGDFGVLVQSGWGKTEALLWNFLSGLTFLLGSVLAYVLSAEIDTSFLIPFAAGNFLYIGAVDLVPEFTRGDAVLHATKRQTFATTLTFILGFGGLYLVYALSR